jgi:hypothetical protein
VGAGTPGDLRAPALHHWLRRLQNYIPLIPDSLIKPRSLFSWGHRHVTQCARLKLALQTPDHYERSLRLQRYESFNPFQWICRTITTLFESISSNSQYPASITHTVSIYGLQMVQCDTSPHLAKPVVAITFGC